jgi:hypothetical protein
MNTGLIDQIAEQLAREARESGQEQYDMEISIIVESRRICRAISSRALGLIQRKGK